ncbi:transducin beta-like protein 3 [Centruroides sculpturatus]|uniref:transducin beta-like protein 3 n=1 Tax=Centruroides sculpturatus TaxID=218467 RepID=UPI000C6E6A8B|nr:transducin beta-like protein 3 [Centruroides sculpturatus]
MATSLRSCGYKESFTCLTKYEAFYKSGNIQFSTDGKSMLCSCTNQMKIVDVETGKIISSIGKDDDDLELTSFVLGNNDRILVTSFRNGLLQQWDIVDNKLIRSWKSIHMGPISCMTFDASDVLLATGGSDSTIKVWDIIKQYCTHNLKGAQGVFSSGRDNVVIMWNIETYENLKTIPVYESLHSIILIPANRKLPNVNVNANYLYFIAAGEKGKLSIWNSHTSNKVYSQKSPITVTGKEADSVIMKALYIPTKDLIAVITYEHNIILYDLENFKLQKQFSGHNDDILDIKCIGKESSHIAVATNSSYIKVFELSTFNCQLLKGHQDLVLSLDTFATAPHYLVSGSKDDTVRVWKMNDDESFTCLYVGFGHTHSVSSVACSRLDHYTFVSCSQDMTIKLWALPKQNNTASNDQSLSSTCTVVAHDKNINSITISPNDKFVATGSQDKTAKVWNSKDLSLVGVCRGHRRGIWCVQFSPLDQVLTSSSADGTIKMWSLSDFSCVKTFQGHECSVLKFIFINNGKQILSSGSDGIIKLWIIKTNEMVKSLDVHTDKVWAITTTNSEDIIISGGADSTIIIWKDVTKEEKEAEIIKNETLILQEQELKNLIKAKDWIHAISLAITLEQPFRALNIIKKILLDSTGIDKLKNIISEMREDQITALLKFCVTWNTNSKHCYPAQVLINIIFRTYTSEQILKFPDAHITVQELLPYTERHFKRVNKLMQQSMFLEYLKCNMKVAT